MTEEFFELHTGLADAGTGNGAHSGLFCPQKEKGKSKAGRENRRDAGILPPMPVGLGRDPNGTPYGRGRESGFAGKGGSSA